MYFLPLSLAFFLSLCLAAPCHNLPQSQVSLRLITSTAYRSSDTQHTLQDPSTIVHLAVGQTLSLDHAPLWAHSISIVAITAGRDVSPRPRAVAKDDWRVVCKAKIGYGSEGAVFGIENGVVKTDGKGRAGEVTGLECWLEGDEGLVGGF